MTVMPKGFIKLTNKITGQSKTFQVCFIISVEANGLAGPSFQNSLVVISCGSQAVTFHARENEREIENMILNAR